MTEPLDGGLHTDSFLLANSVPPAPLSESDARRAAVKELLLGSQRRRYSKGSVLTVGVSRAFASSHNAILPTDEWVASQINLRDLKTSKVHPYLILRNVTSAKQHKEAPLLMTSCNHGTHHDEALHKDGSQSLG